MKRAQLFTLAGLMMASSGIASATTMNFQGLDAALSTAVWMDFTYLAGDRLPNGQLATSPTKISEKNVIGALDVSIDGSLQIQDAFCVDPLLTISNGNYNVNLSSPNTINNGLRAAWMLHNVLPQISAAMAGTQQRNLAAALQMAIWDVVTDNGDGFSSGRIQMSSKTSKPTDAAILSLAQSFISQSAGQTYGYALIISNVNVNALTQRLIVDQPGSGVPEPSTWALALTGLVFAGLRRAKRF